MKILITGGSGFIGSNLSEYLLSRGHKVSAVGRSADQHRIRHENYRYIAADTTRPGEWQKEVEEADAVVNLTGATIFKRWTASCKEMIYNSRILTTRHVVAALPEGRSITLCNASGAGYYGNRGDDILKEDEGVGREFFGRCFTGLGKRGPAGSLKRGSGCRHAIWGCPRKKRRRPG